MKNRQMIKVLIVFFLCTMSIQGLLAQKPVRTDIASSFLNSSVNVPYKAANLRGVQVSKVAMDADYIYISLDVRSCREAFSMSDKAYIASGDTREQVIVDKSKAKFNIYTNEHKRLELVFPNMLDKMKTRPSTLQLRSNAGDEGLEIFDIKIGPEPKPKSKISYTKDEEGNKVKVVTQLKYAAKSRGLNITKIELSNKRTILSFKASGRFFVPNESAICVSNSGKYQFVEKAEGLSLGVWIDVEGVTEYQLYFPPLSKNAKIIDFKELNSGGSWAMYEIELD